MPMIWRICSKRWILPKLQKTDSSAAVALSDGYRQVLFLVIAKDPVRYRGAMVPHLDLENEEIYGQKLTARYRSTNTFLRRDGKWKLIAIQVMVIPGERKAISINPNTLDVYVGSYELAPSVVYHK